MYGYQISPGFMVKYKVSHLPLRKHLVEWQTLEKPPAEHCKNLIEELQEQYRVDLDSDCYVRNMLHIKRQKQST
jgi:hypothetical protein